MQAQIWNLNKWIKETNPDVLNATFDKMINDAGFTVLGKMEHHFNPQGYTVIYLLCESHFAIHTFPEHNTTYIELSSCNKQMQDNFIKLLGNYLDGDLYGNKEE